MEEPKQQAPASGAKLDSTTKFLILVAILVVGGYFAYNKFVGGAQQAADNAAKTAKDTAKDATDTISDVLKGGGSKVDPSDAVGKGIDIFHKGTKVGTDVLDGFIGLSLDEEWKYGDQVRGQILSGAQVSTDAAALQRIERLAKPMLARLQRTKGRPYTFTIIEDPAMNAFAVLGGNIFVFRGLLNEMPEDATIQAVLGHEIGHVELKHCVLGSTAAIRAAEAGGNVAGAIAGQLQRFIVLGYSEEQEFESDKFAYEMQKALGVPKKDRLKCVEALEAYTAKHGGNDDLDSKATSVPGSITKEIQKHYRSHPPAGQRVERLRKLPD